MSGSTYWDDTTPSQRGHLLIRGFFFSSVMFAFHLLNCPRGVSLIVLPEADFTTIIIGRGGERGRERTYSSSYGRSSREREFLFSGRRDFPPTGFAISSFSSRRGGGRHPRRTFLRSRRMPRMEHRPKFRDALPWSLPNCSICQSSCPDAGESSR